MIEIQCTQTILTWESTGLTLTPEFSNWAKINFTPGWFLDGCLAGNPKLMVKTQADVSAYILAWGSDPVWHIAKARRAMPNIIAHDIVGVSPMTGPVGRIFALRKRYGSGGSRESHDT